MARSFIKLTREEREAKILADGIADGTIFPRPEGSSYGDLSHLPEDRDIDLAEQLRAARLDALARDFAITAQTGNRAELILSRRYRDLRFHPRYKREFIEAQKAADNN